MQTHSGNEKVAGHLSGDVFYLHLQGFWRKKLLLISRGLISVNFSQKNYCINHEASFLRISHFCLSLSLSLPLPLSLSLLPLSLALLPPLALTLFPSRRSSASARSLAHAPENRPVPLGGQGAARCSTKPAAPRLALTCDMRPSQRESAPRRPPWLGCGRVSHAAP